MPPNSEKHGAWAHEAHGATVAKKPNGQNPASQSPWHHSFAFHVACRVVVVANEAHVRATHEHMPQSQASGSQSSGLPAAATSSGFASSALLLLLVALVPNHSDQESRMICSPDLYQFAPAQKWIMLS